MRPRGSRKASSKARDREARGRTRYVAFAWLGGPLPRDALRRALEPFGGSLLETDDAGGVARVTHRTAAAAGAALGAAGVRTITTSGTLRAARERRKGPVPQANG